MSTGLTLLQTSNSLTGPKQNFSSHRFCPCPVPSYSYRMILAYPIQVSAWFSPLSIFHHPASPVLFLSSRHDAVQEGSWLRKE